jgi:hypothetical protein
LFSPPGKIATIAKVSTTIILASPVVGVNFNPETSEQVVLLASRNPRNTFNTLEVESGKLYAAQIGA